MPKKVVIGMLKEELSGDQILACTFHPFKDVWWVVVEQGDHYEVATFTHGVCTYLDKYSNRYSASRKLLELWEGPQLRSEP